MESNHRLENWKQNSKSDATVNVMFNEAELKLSSYSRVAQGNEDDEIQLRSGS